MAKKRPKHKKKKIFGYFILVLLIIFAAGYLAHTYRGILLYKPQSDIAAVVNGEKITNAELEKAYAFLQEENVTKEELLEQMITIKVLLQEAAKKGIEVTDLEVNYEIASLVQQIGSKQELDKSLEKIGLSFEEFRERTRRNMIINNLLSEIIEEDIEIREGEIKNFYEKNKHLFEAQEGEVSLEEARATIIKMLKNEKRERYVETYIKQLVSNSDIKKGAEAVEIETAEEKNEFIETGELCLREGKPVVRLFIAKNCLGCDVAKRAFRAAVKDNEDVIAHIWELDTGDNILTKEKEKAIPLSEVQIFKKYSRESMVPAYILGCNYVRIGNAYDTEMPELEEEEIKSTTRKFHKFIAK